MNINKKLRFKKGDSILNFRCIGTDDVTDKYIQGLRNQNTFLENIPDNVSLETQQNYIQTIDDSMNDCIFGLFVNEEMIGTAGVQDIFGSDTPSLGIFVFDSKLRGLGYGKTLVWASCYLIHEVFSCSNLYAGMEKSNIPSLKAFLSSGFSTYIEDKDYYYVKLLLSELILPKDISNIEFY